MSKTEAHTERVTKLFTKISDESSKNLALQELIEIVLLSRLATGKELGESAEVSENINPKVAELLNRNAGDNWLKVNEYSDKLTEEDPEMALELAVDLWFLDTTTGSEEQNEVNAFLATSGLTILGSEKIKEKLARYFENGDKGGLLADELQALMKTDLSSFDTPESFLDPRAYSTLAAIYTGLGFNDGVGTKAQELYGLAKQRALAGDVKSAFKIETDSFEDCDFMKKRFEDVYKEE